MRWWRGVFALGACAVLMTAGAHHVGAQSAAESGEGACSVRVAAVASLDASNTRQAIVLEPTVTGSATLSGSVDVFTRTNQRYDLPFTQATIDSATPVALVFRFPVAVELTGAYVASLDAPSPGPCTLAEPWTAGKAVDAPAQHALAAAIEAAPADAIVVSASPAPDPLVCRVPTGDARMLHAAPPELGFFRKGSVMPAGLVSVRVLVAPNGHAVDVQIDHTDGTIDESAAGTEIRSAALRAALHSTYAPATFRCRPILGIAFYVIQYNVKTAPPEIR